MVSRLIILALFIFLVIFIQNYLHVRYFFITFAAIFNSSYRRRLVCFSFAGAKLLHFFNTCKFFAEKMLIELHFYNFWFKNLKNRTFMKTQKERLLEFIEASGYSIREFERLLGVSNATINHITDTLSANLKEKISAKFQQLNMDWLLHGTGNMLKNMQTSNGDPSNGDGSMQNVSGDNNSVGVPQKKFTHEDEWFALVAEKDRQISRLLTIIEKMQDK